MIVRWGLGELPSVLAEVGAVNPLVVCSERWTSTANELPISLLYTGVGSHADARGVDGALTAARMEGADAFVPLGGGSAIDTAKAASSETGLPVISIPTTYSGSEWTPFFGSRDHETGIKRAGTGAVVRGIVYEPELTLGLPPPESAGTALNALAHCAEALYTKGHGPETDRDALTGAGLIAEWLPAVLADGADVKARTELLRGAMHAGASLRAGMGVAHAMAQALGGRFALPHGAMNAIALPAGLRFNAEVATSELARFADAMGVEDPVSRVEELATASGPTRLRDRGVPHDELPAVAEVAAARPAAKANPRPSPPEAILELLESVW